MGGGSSGGRQRRPVVALPIRSGAAILGSKVLKSGGSVNLVQVNVFVSDLAAMLEFYRDTLGFGVNDIDPGPPCVPLVNWVSLQSGSAAIELFDADVFSDRALLSSSNRNAAQLCFLVNDAAKARDRLAAAGVDIDSVVTQGWGRYASFRDPEGNLLQVFEVFDSSH